MRLTMDYNTKAGVVGGTLLSSIINIGVEDIITTIVLATIGATVSFIISALLRWVVKQIKQ